MALATSRPDKVVGFHFFYPASMMRLVEIVEGEDTSPETMQVATTFAQTIRKLPITCGEEPGFVVNRILNSAISEVWRMQEEGGLSIKAIDDAVAASRVAPMGPFFLTDLLGLDTVLHVAEHLHDVLRRQLLRPRGHARARRGRRARREDRQGLLRERRAALGAARRSSTPTSSRSASC